MIRKIFLIIAAIVLIYDHSFSQVNYDKNFLDSLYNYYVSLRNQEVFSEEISNKNPADIKCGFGLAWEIKHNFERFTIEQQIVLRKLLQRPSKQTSIISPSDHFRIHYDTTGFEIPNYNPMLTTEENVAEVAAALDSTYNFEVNFLGYPPPPQDNNEGGDNLYDVYITTPLGYGSTSTESFLGDQKYTSYMEIHYDFKNFYTKGLNAMRVTVAHEFHHGIQMGNYILRSEDMFFYEITSTSMEEFVYDDVNDYYFYMSHYFNNTGKLFSQFVPRSFDGYDLAIWNLYLKENFDISIIKRQWELMPTQRAINAINTSLTEVGSSFKHELNNFGVWTYHTKHHAIPGKYFEEASFYPLIRPLSTITFTSPDEVVTINSKATANNFIRFTNQINNEDTLFVLITNGDVQGALNNISQTDSFAYYLYDYPESGTNQIDSNYYSRFTTKNPFLWSVTEISDTVINVVEPQLKTDFPYPMPFSYKKHSSISVPISSDNRDNIGLYIFSTAMELVYSNDDMPRDNQNENVVKWKVKDNQGRNLASGVYIYVVKSGDKIEKGKLVILHD